MTQARATVQWRSLVPGGTDPATEPVLRGFYYYAASEATAHKYGID